MAISDTMLSTSEDYFKMISEKLTTFRTRGEYCDVKVEVGDKIFTCNRIILASNSDLFKKLFNKAEKEEVICVENVDPVIFEKLLEAFYGRPFNVGVHIISLYNTCVNLQLNFFINKCREFILNNLDDIDNVKLIMVPEIGDDENLYKLVRKNICKNFTSYDYDKLCAIPLNIFKDILTDPNLIIFDIEQILEFVKSWVNYDLSNRWKDLYEVACCLKPSHVPPELANQFVINMGNQTDIWSDFKLNVALTTLLTDSKISAQESIEETATDSLSIDKFNNLFFMKSHDDSDVSFTTYAEDSFVFLDELKCSLKLPICGSSEGTVCDSTLFVSTLGTDLLSMFGSCNLETGKWNILSAPSAYSDTLITCNSKCFSQQFSFQNDFQIYVYEPSLNRWLTLPSVKYPREASGLATDGKLLFLVGGMPLRKINSESPKNIIEFYDDRSKHWSRIIARDTCTIHNMSYAGKVVINNQKLFVFDAHMKIFDLRMNSWMSSREEDDYDPDTVAYVAAEKHSIWYIRLGHKDGTIRMYDLDGEKKNVIQLPSDFLKPLFVPL